jgi:general stress protein 26
MNDPEVLKSKFWAAIRAHPTVMLCTGEDSAARPMTAQFQAPSHDVWFFASRRSPMVTATDTAARLIYVGKGHDLFATVRGTMRLDRDPARIDQLWSPAIAAWYKGGKQDPDLALLRFRPQDAEIWLNEFSLVAGIKLLLGADPKREFADTVAKDVRL